jgi:cellulose synthase/poly-beta-1,6-N-acetylglucosamine synthase-like glycosyltransferase
VKAWHLFIDSTGVHDSGRTVRDLLLELQLSLFLTSLPALPDMAPKYSVILPTYNERENLVSILKQRFSSDVDRFVAHHSLAPE